MEKLFKKLAHFKQSGIISPLILIGVVSVLVLFVILGTLPFKDSLLSGLFPKSDSQAAGVVDLSLVPQTVSVGKDQTFLVDVAIDAKTDQPSAMVLEINYDSSVLQATAAQQGFFFTEDLDPSTPKISSGKIQMTLGQKPNQYKTGHGIIATLEFKALQPTVPTSAISFNTTNTQIAAIGKTGNQAGVLANSTVTITNTPAVTKTAEFSLTSPTSAAAGSQFNVVVRAKSLESSNLFAADLNFNPALLEVVSINTTGSFITQWVNDNTFDNGAGTVSLLGGVPAPGFSSSTASTMATIVFRGKAAGAGAISFGAGSAIYRNSDNVNILITPVTGASVDITGTAAVCGNGTQETGEQCDDGSNNGSCPKNCSTSCQPNSCPLPSASPSPAPSASPAASLSPSPSPSTGPVACTITSANWVTSANPANQGQVVGLNVVGAGNCAGQSVSFTVLEDDNLVGGLLGGTDPVKNSPPTTKFNSSNVATSNWLAEYQDDPSVIENNVPEYFFNAQLTTGTSFKSANPLLKVNKLGGGLFLTGDANKDGVVDRVDLSILLSNWNKTQDFLDELDLNSDGTVNAIDWSTMIQILKVTGVIQ